MFSGTGDSRKIPNRDQASAWSAAAGETADARNLFVTEDNRNRVYQVMRVSEGAMGRPDGSPVGESILHVGMGPENESDGE